MLSTRSVCLSVYLCVVATTREVVNRSRGNYLHNTTRKTSVNVRVAMSLDHAVFGVAFPRGMRSNVHFGARVLPI